MIGTYLRKTVNQSIRLTKRDLETCNDKKTHRRTN